MAAVTGFAFGIIAGGRGPAPWSLLAAGIIALTPLLAFGTDGFPGHDGRLAAADTRDERVPRQSAGEGVATLSGGDLYALVVGISRYENPKVPPLRGAANDSASVARFLESQKDLYSEQRIDLITDEKATRAELMRSLTERIQSAGKDDTVVIFFSGHGAVDPKQTGRFYFLTHDADPDRLEDTAMDMTGLSFLKEIACPRVLLIADACHSGGFAESKAETGSSPLKRFARDFGSAPGRILITSSRPNEYSLESRYRENGVFTHWLIEGLNGAADTGGRGVVTIHDAYNFAYQQTKVETNGAQHPQFQGATQGTFPLAITASLQGKIPTLLELTFDPCGSEVIVGGLLKGGTDDAGILRLKYLPVGKPIPVVVRKNGWLKHEVTPDVEFSEARPRVTVPPVTLNRAVATLDVTTSPGDVTVKINGRPVGKTDAKGKLIVADVQIFVNHVIELEKEGFNRKPLSLTIPPVFLGGKAELEPVQLTRVSTARPIDRVKNDFGGVFDRRRESTHIKKLEHSSAKDREIMDELTFYDKWSFDIMKQSKRFRDSIHDRLYWSDQVFESMHPGRKERKMKRLQKFDTDSGSGSTPIDERLWRE